MGKTAADTGKELAIREWEEMKALLGKHSEYRLEIVGDEAKLHAPFKETTNVTPWENRHKFSEGLEQPKKMTAVRTNYSFIPVENLRALHLKEAIEAIDSAIQKKTYVETITELVSNYPV